jgi:hypothetical protein
MATNTAKPTYSDDPGFDQYAKKRAAQDLRAKRYDRMVEDREYLVGLRAHCNKMKRYAILNMLGLLVSGGYAVGFVVYHMVIFDPSVHSRHDIFYNVEWGSASALFSGFCTFAMGLWFLWAGPGFVIAYFAVSMKCSFDEDKIRKRHGKLL